MIATTGGIVILVSVRVHRKGEANLFHGLAEKTLFLEVVICLRSINFASKASVKAWIFISKTVQLRELLTHTPLLSKLGPQLPHQCILWDIKKRCFLWKYTCLACAVLLQTFALALRVTGKVLCLKALLVIDCVIKDVG